MKKIILILEATIVLLALPVICFADGGEVINTQPELVNMVLTFGAFASTVTIATDMFFQLIKSGNKRVNQILSWLVALVVAVLAKMINLGVFENMEWWLTIVYAIAGGLAANGIADVKMLKSLLQLIRNAKIG